MLNTLEEYKISLTKLLGILNTRLQVYALITPGVSEKNIGWHIQHSLIVINEYIDSLNQSDPEGYKWKFNFLRMIVIATKLVPRYFGNAPESLLPVNSMEKERLSQYISETKDNILQIKELPKNAYVDHPVFYKLNFIEAIDYLETHTKHHIKIIDDIVKQHKEN